MLDVARRARSADGEVVLAVLTDGRATGSADAVQRALDAGAAIRAAGVQTIVLDCETGATRLGLAAGLAAVRDRWQAFEPGPVGRSFPARRVSQES